MSQTSLLRVSGRLSGRLFGRLSRTWPLALVPWLVAAPAMADNSAMLRCRTIAETSARLACYDAIALPGLGSRSGWGAPLPGAVPVAPGVPAAPLSPIDSFGLEGRAAAAGGPAAQLTSSIPGRFEGWNAKTRFRLANGQIWALAENTEAFYQLDSPKVTIKRGLFDAMYMHIEGVAQTPRVKRVQ